MRFVALLGIGVLGLLAAPVGHTQEPKPPVAAATADEQVELHRLRIVNGRFGPIQVSTDKGQTWHLIGRVTTPATGATEGYIAAEYAPQGSVAAVAVHGLRIRVSGEDPTLHAPLVLSIAPRELSTDRANYGFGGHHAGEAGMKTDIPAGTGLFRVLAPLPGNPVYVETRGGRLQQIGDEFKPLGHGEALVIPVMVPANRLSQLVIENRVGGAVTATFADGTTKLLTHVVRPVRGVGRFDGTAYTGVGRINTAHTGVVTVSTAPINNTLPEGEGKERRGGFQITPAWHNARTEEHDAPMMLILGALAPDGKPTPRRRDLEGTAPLFLGHIALTGEAPVVDCRIDKGPWEPLPAIVGARMEAFTGDGLTELWKANRIARSATDGVTAFRFRFPLPSPDGMPAIVARLAENYRKDRLAAARASKMPIVSGSVTINPSVTDPSRVAFVRLSVDGAVKALKNFAPFSLSWDTTRLPDGEYFIEVEALDSSGVVLASTPRRVFVLNERNENVENETRFR